MMCMCVHMYVCMMCMCVRVSQVNVGDRLLKVNDEVVVELPPKDRKCVVCVCGLVGVGG